MTDGNTGWRCEKPELAAIVERVEAVRRRCDLGKSAFCAAFSMAPQTYNNFIGAQGSKPNVELVLGVCQAYGVRADWLLWGREPVFAEGELPAPAEKARRREAFAAWPEAQRLDMLERLEALEGRVDLLESVFPRRVFAALEGQHEAERPNGGGE